MSETRDNIDTKNAYAGVEWIAVGIALGVAIGAAIGLTILDNIGAGLGIGIALGAGLGVALMILASSRKNAKNVDNKPASSAEDPTAPPVAS